MTSKFLWQLHQEASVLSTADLSTGTLSVLINGSWLSPEQAIQDRARQSLQVLVWPHCTVIHHHFNYIPPISIQHGRRACRRAWPPQGRKRWGPSWRWLLVSSVILRELLLCDSLCFLSPSLSLSLEVYRM